MERANFPDEQKIRFSMYMQSDAIRQALEGVARDAILVVIHKVMDEKFESLREAGSQPKLFNHLQKNPNVLEQIYAEIGQALQKAFNLSPDFTPWEYRAYITMVMAEELDKGRGRKINEERIKNSTMTTQTES